VHLDGSHTWSDLAGNTEVDDQLLDFVVPDAARRGTTPHKAIQKLREVDAQGSDHPTDH
jgi:hypothetical protein